MKDQFNKFVEILEIEANAVSDAAKRIDKPSIEKAIGFLTDCEGKVIVAGVGKSGVIAQKIAQTMTSTGTVAIFVHPSDALHGSLGVIAQGDVFIALSNSGETDELVMLLPALKSRGTKIISIVGNMHSTLARQSDVALDASVDKEACPLNLAPTTSTTVALSIGDALAMTVMTGKNLTAEDFAANHPAGRLGKRLTVKVSALMHESPNVSPEDGWLAVVKAISKYTLGAVNVVDAENRLVGIVTDGDLRRTIEKIAPERFSTLKADEMMTADPIVASPEMLAFDALRMMEDRPRQISVLPVVDENGGALGIVRLHDIVRSGL
ncbi:MAG: KpsF/GutQ family sugar-phosphate isomerase [Pyrinomonadaceae bacterium]|nr:KpsF/GutQ family sugar-phosphate isomerase [Pyrinomonadaceae bacterium]